MRRIEICSRLLIERRFATARAEARVSRQPVVAASADGAVLSDDGVADLAGRPPHAVRQAPAGDEPAADAGGDLEVGDLGAALRRAPCELGKGAQVGVVLDGHRQVEPRAGLGRRVDSDPAGQDRRVPDRAGQAVDRRRKAHDRADHPAAVQLGLVEDLVDEVACLRKALAGRRVDVELAPALGEHGVREVRHGDSQVAMAEVDRQRDAGGRVEGDHHAGAAGVCLAFRLAVALDREAGVDQVADDRGDRRAGELRCAGELRTARDAPLSQRFDHQPTVAFPQGGE